ncbi:MAG: Pr6Pr family membrane protein [Ginsengibacter sp.]
MLSQGKMKLFLGVITVCGWFAIVAQFYLIIENRVASIPETIVRFFSFFTILTNLLVAVYATSLLLNRKSGFRMFFLKPSVVSAIAVYITIVGMVYNIILRHLWKPEGLQWIVDELLHTAIPIMFIAVWFFFIPKGRLPWKNVAAWMLYPLFYIVFILWRGSFSSYYPYPFIDVSVLGFTKVLINSTGMLIAFLVVSVLFVILDRYKKT